MVQKIKMIKVQGKLDRDLYVACSGGVDSMAIVKFLSNNHNVSILHMDHKEGNSHIAREFVTSYARQHRLPIIIADIANKKPHDQSWEEFWRNERYNFFHNKIDGMVVTGHHLDDCVETWVWSCLHGKGKIIPYSNRNVVRPFMQNTKESLIAFAKKHRVKHIEDESNNNMAFSRNIIRKELLPIAYKVNPGLQKVILKKIINNIVED